MEWEREESWFMNVAPTERFFLPASNTFSISETPLTTYDVRSFTNTPRSLSSLSSRLVFGVLGQQVAHFFVIDLQERRADEEVLVVSGLNLLEDSAECTGNDPTQVSAGSHCPSIVCVFPVPVCPYANTVPLYP